MGEPADDDAGRQSQPEQDQRGEADRLVRKRVGIHEEVDERARRARDPGGSPADDDAPAGEQ